MADDGIGGLFGVELEAFGDFDADTTCLEEVCNFGVVREVRTCGITPGITSTSILLTEETCDRRPVFVGNAKFFSDATVPQFRKRLGHFYAKTVQKEIALILVGRKKLLATLGDALSHRDEHEAGVVLAP